MTVTMTTHIAVELIRANASDQMVADAARVSTAGESAADIDRPIAGLIRALMRDKHGSPFEHTSFTFRVIAPLFVMTEHLRHRAGWSYNGESGRYRTMDPVFYTPPADRGITQVGKAMDYDIQPGAYPQVAMVAGHLARVADDAFTAYNRMLDFGIAREVARMVLPVNLMTTYYVSCNARSLMSFLALRTEHPDATFPSKPLAEIQTVAAGYERAFTDAMPITSAAFTSFGRVAP